MPQLLMHGQRDSSVPPNESRRWAMALDSLGRGSQIDFVEYPDEDHTLKRYRATVRDKLLRMESFFARHLRLPPPACATSSSRCATTTCSRSASCMAA